MNEQLTVKNFGPIKDATVDFKRVTVFIGPTGGGKSTLAKLAAICRDIKLLGIKQDNIKALEKYNLFNHADKESIFGWFFDEKYFYLEEFEMKFNDLLAKSLSNYGDFLLNDVNKIINRDNIKNIKSKKQRDLFDNFVDNILSKNIELAMDSTIRRSEPHYIPSERIFVPAIEYSWAGLMRDDIGLSKTLLDFANSFSTSRKDIPELNIPFLKVKYLHIDGRDFIKIPEREEPLMLLETASGIQSVTPMLVLLEHLSRRKEQAQSFIIEEPELNLYPIAQRDLVYWLLEKCTQGENDLTLTTHSPYVLSALNLALYANKVVTLFPHQHKKVAKLIPEKYWLKAEEFSAYLVSDGGVKSIFDIKTSLLSESQLDEVSGEFADIFDHLTDLRVPDKKTVLKAKSEKK